MMRSLEAATLAPLARRGSLFFMPFDHPLFPSDFFLLSPTAAHYQPGRILDFSAPAQRLLL